MSDIIFFGRKESEELLSAGLTGLNEFLGNINDKLKQEYHKSKNPIELLHIISRVLIEVCELPSRTFSLQYAVLLTFYAQLIIETTQDTNELKKAYVFINDSIEICLRSDDITLDTNRLIVKNALLLSVFFKLFGNYAESFKTLSEYSALLTKKRGASELDLIMLSRQETMMVQSIDGHKKLLEKAIKYKDIEPLEYYRTLKRVFEFSMNHDLLKISEKILPELKQAIYLVRKDLTPIAHISFIKNLGQYYLMKKEPDVGLSLLQFILVKSDQLNLTGQRRQIEKIINDYNNGRPIFLPTARY